MHRTGPRNGRINPHNGGQLRRTERQQMHGTGELQVAPAMR
jgi:hypothetical protein